MSPVIFIILASAAGVAMICLGIVLLMRCACEWEHRAGYNQGWKDAEARWRPAFTEL